MTRLVAILFRDAERAKTTIAVGGTALAAVGFIVVVIAMLVLR